MKKEIAKRIERGMRGVTLYQLRKDTGIGGSILKNILEQRNYGIDLLEKLAEYLGVDLSMGSTESYLYELLEAEIYESGQDVIMELANDHYSIDLKYDLEFETKRNRTRPEFQLRTLMAYKLATDEEWIEIPIDEERALKIICDQINNQLN